MMRFTPEFQLCLGVSSIIVSLCGGLAMLGGAFVDVSVGNANLSVNRQLQEVAEIKQKVDDTVNSLKSEPSVSPLKIEALEQELKAVDRQIDRNEKTTEEQLDRLRENDI